MIHLLILLLLAFLVPGQFEGSLRLSLSRTVALGRTWGRLQLVGAFVPYRPNRVYYRLAVARV